MLWTKCSAVLTGAQHQDASVHRHPGGAVGPDVRPQAVASGHRLPSLHHPPHPRPSQGHELPIFWRRT